MKQKRDVELTFLQISAEGGERKSIKKWSILTLGSQVPLPSLLCVRYSVKLKNYCITFVECCNLSI